MKFSCETASLQKALNITEKSVSQRTAMPVLENLYFEIEESGLTIRGNDLELGIQAKIPVVSATDTGRFLVKGKTISSIISKIYEETISFSVDSDHKIIIQADSIDFELLGVSVDEYPEFPGITGNIVKSLTVGALRSLIRYTLFSVSTDETKQFLNGIMVESKADSILFVATDGYRLSLKRDIVSNQSPDFNVIIPHKTLNELNKIIQNLDADTPVQFFVSDHQVGIVVGNIVLVSRVIQGQFPDYRQVIPDTSENRYQVSRRSLIDAAERASIIASSSNNVVRFYFAGDGLTIRAQSPNTGEFKETIKLETLAGTGEPKIAFNIKLMLEALRNIESDRISIEFNGELSPCKITPVQDTDYTYILMPIRTSEFGAAV
jgi:DNA polymerase III subunit beta